MVLTQTTVGSTLRAAALGSCLWIIFSATTTTRHSCPQARLKEKGFCDAPHTLSREVIKRYDCVESCYATENNFTLVGHCQRRCPTPPSLKILSVCAKFCLKNVTAIRTSRCMRGCTRKTDVCRGLCYLNPDRRSFADCDSRCSSCV